MSTSIFHLPFQMVADFQRKLIALSCIFEIELSSDLERPRVVQLVDFSRLHAELLYRRLVANLCA